MYTTSISRFIGLIMNLSSSLLDFIFPARCAGCRTHTEGGSALCEPCFKAIPFHTSFFCGACRARRITSTRVCHPRFPYLLAPALDYHNPTVTALIHTLKFRGAESAVEPLSRLMVAYLSSLSLALPRPVIIPIPLSAKRERERGFNQSLLIARHIANHFSLDLAPQVLVRTRNTKAQSETKGFMARKENVRGCFRVTDSLPVVGRNIILIDDVVTSGATLKEASTELKNAGALRIVALTAAMA